MKKLTLMFFSLAATLLILPAVSWGAENIASSPATTTSSVNISDASFFSKVGHILDVSFTLSNKTGVQTGVRYGVELRSSKTGIVVDRLIYPETEVLVENATLKKEISYTPPGYLKGMYQVFIVSESEGGLGLGFAKAGEIELNGDGKFLEVSKCLLSISGDEKPYLVDEPGIIISPEQNLTLTCTLKNMMGADISSVPRIIITSQAVFGSTILQEDAPPAQIKKGVTQEISLIIPKVKSYSKIYYATIYFVGGSNESISNPIFTNYTIRGENAVIKNIVLNQDSYKDGDSAQVSLEWITSANKTMLKIEILDSNNQNCAETLTKELNKDEVFEKNNIAIISDCQNGKMKVTLRAEDGSVFDEKTIDFKKVPVVPEVETKDARNGLPYIIGGLLFVAIAIILRFNKKNLGLVIVFLLISIAIIKPQNVFGAACGAALTCSEAKSGTAIGYDYVFCNLGDCNYTKTGYGALGVVPTINHTVGVTATTVQKGNTITFSYNPPYPYSVSGSWPSNISSHNPPIMSGDRSWETGDIGQWRTNTNYFECDSASCVVNTYGCNYTPSTCKTSSCNSLSGCNYSGTGYSNDSVTSGDRSFVQTNGASSGLMVNCSGGTGYRKYTNFSVFFATLKPAPTISAPGMTCVGLTCTANTAGTLTATMTIPSTSYKTYALTYRKNWNPTDACNAACDETYSWSNGGTGTIPGTTFTWSSIVVTEPTVNGTCGSSNGQTWATTPPNLCNTGVPSTPILNNVAHRWEWSCNGSGTPAGTLASCQAPYPVNGVCATPPNGDTQATAPTPSCSAGNASGLTTNATTWTWWCDGINTGSPSPTCITNRTGYCGDGVCNRPPENSSACSSASFGDCSCITPLIFNTSTSRVDPPSVYKGQNYTVKCDYGVAGIDSIRVTTESGTCAWGGYTGTEANFNCNAGTELGNFSAYCYVVGIGVDGATSDYCPKSNSLSGEVTVTAFCGNFDCEPTETNADCPGDCTVSGAFDLVSNGDLIVYVDKNLPAGTIKKSNVIKITAKPSGGFGGDIDFTVGNPSPSVSGFSSGFNPTKLQSVAADKKTSFYVSVPNSTQTGTKKMTITGTSGGFTDSVEVSLKVLDVNYENK